MTARIVLLMLILLFAACNNIASDGRSGDVAIGYRSGSGEKNFEQVYRPPFVLPVAESDFLIFLKQRHMDYTVFSGTQKVDWPYISPLHARMDPSQVQRGYDIFDSKISGKRYAAHFVAYVDHAGKIFYIENQFQYEE